MVDDSTLPRAETLYYASAIFQDDAYLDVSGPKRVVKKDKFLDNSLDSGKDKPSYLMNGRTVFYHVEEKTLNRFMEGPAKKRAVLFKPPFPTLSKSLYGEEENFTARLRFTISEEGNVGLIEPIISSGSPLIDLECIKYLKQWKFSPKVSQDREKEWGIITLNIKAK